ncbi:MAG: shikimate dehydrogenase [Bacteroidetes bacterium]|nr:shikimate dehydrogenase [Bacteroidota bacterium]
MKQFGLIGKSLGHSFSQRYFQDKFQKENRSDHSYQLFEIDSIEEFPALVERSQNIMGLNVTLPFKMEIIPFLDELEEAAKSVGAVNTIEFLQNGSLKGWNTDVIGFRESLLPLLKPHHRRAYILGDGGASQAVQYVLKELDIPFDLVSRKGPLTFNSIQKNDLKDHPLIIQTTPLGMFPNVDEKVPMILEGIGENHLVFDLIYNPELTRFLMEAQLRGAQIKNGMEMLHLQAEAAWKIWNT